jgi:hypothetical protein
MSTLKSATFDSGELLEEYRSNGLATQVAIVNATVRRFKISMYLTFPMDVLHSARDLKVQI